MNYSQPDGDVLIDLVEAGSRAGGIPAFISGEHRAGHYGLDVTYVDAIAKKIEANLDEADRPDSNALALYRLYALLALVKGQNVTLSDVHDAWSVWMTSSQPDHPALIPFNEFDEEQRLQDSPYAVAIRIAAQ